MALVIILTASFVAAVGPVEREVWLAASGIALFLAGRLLGAQESDGA